ncbi:hypothetical protein MBAV_004517 [Candidatus Magnetobacterium bavaricum]|uniref:Uncharacterized protein n=1 Tax=Candidatus Magnetobacterium bavaricum TaxID=29290 RepID=A0A0F3GRG3_9BACT|nr:hypothetical protein MBAV_004517 [Candidatus Magnetobacterium bavaricum]
MTKTDKNNTPIEDLLIIAMKKGVSLLEKSIRDEEHMNQRKSVSLCRKLDQLVMAVIDIKQLEILCYRSKRQKEKYRKELLGWEKFLIENRNYMKEYAAMRLK